MCKIIPVLLALGLAGLPVPSAAQFRPVGLPFATGDTLGLDAAGNFTAAWRSSYACPGLGWGCVYAQRYDPRGAPRGETISVASEPFFIISADVVVAPQGHFAVTWTRDDMGYHESVYSLYDAAGNFVRHGHLGWSFPARIPLAASDAAGNIVFAYDDSDGVYATVIGPDGLARVDPFFVDGVPETGWSTRGVIADWSSGFTVFWVSSSGKWARRYRAGGEPVGMPFHVEEFSQVAGGPSGEFVLAWLSPGGAGDPALWARRYGTNRTALGDPFQVSAATARAPGRDGIAIDARGDVTFAWTQPVSAGADAAYARRYHADGTPYGPPFRVNPTPAGSETYAQAFCEPVGHCLLTWSGLGQRYHVQPREQPAKGDFDRDLRTDLLLRDADSGNVRWWTLVDGVRTANVPVWGDLPDTTWSCAGDGDFDGDGRNDLAFRHDASGVLRFWLLGGAAGNEVHGTLPLYGASAPSNEWALSATGDFTFDGWPDLVWQHRGSGRIEVWRMAGALRTAVLEPTPAGPADPAWRVIAAQDWNGDGARDLLFSHAASGRLVQWLLDPALKVIGGRFTNPSSAADPAWKIVASGDYGVGAGGVAGTADVIWRHDVSGRQVIWYFDFAGNRTSGIFTNPMAPSNPSLHACGPR